MRREFITVTFESVDPGVVAKINRNSPCAGGGATIGSIAHLAPALGQRLEIIGLGHDSQGAGVVARFRHPSGTGVMQVAARHLMAVNGKKPNEADFASVGSFDDWLNSRCRPKSRQKPKAKK
ncbi:MAG: hypothetical protein WC480_02080 [Patescibacteria group bacterium]